MSKRFPSSEEILEVLDKEIGQSSHSDFSEKDIYELKELLSLDGEDFVYNAYAVILKRSPDPTGFRHYLTGLQQGIFSKEFVLGSLYYSKEGRTKGVRIKGLCWIYPFHFLKKSMVKLKIYLSKLNIIKISHNLIKLEKELTTLKQQIKQLGKKRPSPAADVFYSQLEEKFRGKEQEIKESFLCYLPWIEELVSKFKNKEFLILDLGCGRGEWLSLLKEHNFLSLGIDTNPIFINRCQNKNLNVLREDIFHFLSKQKDNSFPAITCFQLLEHLSFSEQYFLLSEVFRVLMPGGIAIFETPNPRNILVGSGDFYRDPTHKNPVFPDTLELLGKHIGFQNSTAFFFTDERKDMLPVSQTNFYTLDDYVKISRDFVWRGIK